MTVTVTLLNRFLGRGEAPQTKRHPRAKATLIDGLGSLLVLDDDQFPEPLDPSQPQTFLITTAWTIQHVVASYASGEWSSVTRS